MKFTVLWSRHSETKLAGLWSHSSDRQALSDAADKIDDALRDDADHVGESRSGNRRILHEPPLGVMFSIDTSDRKVLVLDVWKYNLHDQ